MSELTEAQFDDYFEALWARPPFVWQRQVARRVMNNTTAAWPEAIALPTASGKTACLDIAVFALAVQAYAAELSVPRRIFFVVDRRLIVDEVYRRAFQIADKLRKASSGVLKDVADRLRYLARGEHQKIENELPLSVHELRGGMYRSEAWAHTPLQPTVVAATVDQLGSRLMFRAYGRRSGMWPVYAGLVGNDSLIFLDEAHCAKPFMQTLQAVTQYRQWAEMPLVSPFYPVVMSATPPAGLKDVFRDESREKSDPDHPLGKRQLAGKPAKLQVAQKAKGKQAPLILANELMDAALDLVNGKNKAVVIFCNRVATARETCRLLRQKHSEQTVLLTGRMRAIDRDDTVSKQLVQLSSAKSEQRQLAQPLFVVATQTLEVGADLDFDLLVSECAPLDALRQRFGRLNRIGRPIEAKAIIIVRSDQSEKSEDDPVYGQALANTWGWLTEQSAAQGQGQGEVDFGISVLDANLPDGEELAALNAPSANAPVMLPAHIDCWVQTSPEPEPTPDVGLFLRGPQRGTADVQVCWRGDLDLNNKKKSIEVLIACPPATIECVSVPIGIMRQWINGRLKHDYSTDVVTMDLDDTDNQYTETQRQVILWRGRNEIEIAKPQDLRPGDVIIIPATTGGWNKLGHLPLTANGKPILDWGDRAYTQSKAKPILRLHPGVIQQWPECASKEAMIDFMDNIEQVYHQDPDTVLGGLKELLMQLSDDELLLENAKWLCDVAMQLVKEKSFSRITTLHPLGGFIIKGRERVLVKNPVVDDFSDEDDATASGTARALLREHLPGVANYARRYATASQLPEELVATIEQAALFHDLGKADPRFQALLKGGLPLVNSEPLAKSDQLPSGWLSFEKARKKAGYPESARHELLSVRLAQSVPQLLPDDPHQQDLLMHLIASHHGYCRPFAPVVIDEAPCTVTWRFQEHTFSHSSETGLERFDADVPDRFWRLVRRYGWWGLAWLEAILRLADHRRSEAETKPEVERDKSR